MTVKTGEMAGNTSKSVLTASDPFPRSKCGRVNCSLVQGEEECWVTCFTSNINYIYRYNSCIGQPKERRVRRRDEERAQELEEERKERSRMIR